MYRLRNLKIGLFQIHSSSHRNAYEGTPETLFKQVMRMGIPEKELIYAVNRLYETGDDYANFSRYGDFLGTCKDSKGSSGSNWH